MRSNGRHGGKQTPARHVKTLRVRVACWCARDAQSAPTHGADLGALVLAAAQRERARLVAPHDVRVARDGPQPLAALAPPLARQLARRARPRVARCTNRRPAASALADCGKRLVPAQMWQRRAGAGAEVTAVRPVRPAAGQLPLDAAVPKGNEPAVAQR